MGDPIDADALPPLLARSSVVLFGDSLTQRGFEPGGWASALAHHLGRRADVYNRGYGGYNARWASYLAPALFPDPSGAPGRHLLVTVWFGANDAADAGERAHVPLDEFARRLELIVARARRAARAVVVLTPPPVHGPTRLAYQRRRYGARATGVEERTTAGALAYGAEAARVARAAGAHVLDVGRLMVADDGWPAFVGAGDADGDGLHLSAAGQRFVADALIGALPGLGLDRDGLAYDLPWGFEVDAADPETSLARHFAAHGGRLAAGDGVPARGAPPAGSLLDRVLTAPAATTFLLGLALGAYAVLLRGRRRAFRGA
jgi:lysophospholipase L1-like esterase